MGNQSLDRAQDSLFDLKLTSKRFGKAHKKAMSKQKAALAKVKKVRCRNVGTNEKNELIKCKHSHRTLTHKNSYITLTYKHE